jgi:hypothetical protein
MAGGELDYVTSRRTRTLSRGATSRSQTAIPLTNYCLALHTRSNTMIMQYTENACSRIRCVHIRNTDLKFWTVSSCLSDSHALCCYFCLPYTKCTKTGYWEGDTCHSACFNSESSQRTMMQCYTCTYRREVHTKTPIGITFDPFIDAIIHYIKPSIQ